VALIKSISGIRGTIGGVAGDNLTPLDVVRFTAAYGSMLLDRHPAAKVVIGRDGRISGALVSSLVSHTLSGMGIAVADLGLSTTPTVEMAVVSEGAAGGIIITASHNPKEWNALKLLNSDGEFISAAEGATVLERAASESFTFAPVDKLGIYRLDETQLEKHIQALTNYALVDVPSITARKFKVVVDAVNSTGAIAVPALLKALGVREQNITVLNEEVNGRFAHNPEPLPENLSQLSTAVNRAGADLGIAVDPDVDRLVLVCEDGSMFGEEYTLVAVADYVLSKRKGDTVSNLSSSRALRDITEKHGGRYHPSAVGEVNVVKKMKEVNAVIGGEGNGGIIVPDLHYGRDALAGIALFLTYLAGSGKSTKQIRNSYPDYFISKNKIELERGVDLAAIFERIKHKYRSQPVNTEDGLRIEFDQDWVHLRASNTEPIIRIIAESRFDTMANNIALKLMQDIRESK
jgi:phosphomannomutase